MNARIVITGYASLDHVAMLDGSPRAGRTTTILDRPTQAWPRLGGSPAYMAAALTASGIASVAPLSWIGDDEQGETYRSQLAARAIAAGGIEIVQGARTPIAVLAYEPDGGCICLYHPGTPASQSLSARQRSMIKTAEWACVTIGPQAANEQVLTSLGAQTNLAWVVKNDPRAMPLDLAARYTERADLICHSAAEAGFLVDAMSAAGVSRPGQIVIETHGRTGAEFRRDGKAVFVPAEPIQVNDPTGAGDTFAGGVLAALVRGETDPVEIVGCGHRAARAMLETRRNDQ